MAEEGTGKPYEVLASCTVGGVRVQKLRSTKTGIVVCLAQVEGPLVNGYFCLATEAYDHDGLPHTLEHLIFLGSEQYPYKGVLDLLANRCLAQGTNAWTDVDHTCYTVTTAGSEGFLNLLPIYLDHVLYPTLSDAAFLTEVHHINGEGDDAGVVYCEMQARENSSEDRTHFQMLQHMYPGHCGYKSETGGRLENLRTSCSNEKVCAYHRSFYRPDNLCLIVTGQVEPERLFEALTPFEERVLGKGPLPPMERPWQSAVPPMEGSVCEEVPFPTDDEADGMARVVWRGPRAQDRYQFTAMGSLLEYLVETSVAPLQRDLVETEDPFCSSVDQLVLENAESCVGVTLNGVPTDKLGTVKDKVLSILSGIADGSEAFDLKRMETVIQRQICNILNRVEEHPHFFFAFSLIGEFLFSQTPEQFSAYMDQVPHYRQLLREPSSFWVTMVKRCFVDAPCVAILGCPSHELAEKMSVEEKERVKRQGAELGEEGLQKKAQELERAIQHNEIPAPSGTITSLPVPGTDSIHFHPLVAMGNHRPANEIEGLPEYSRFPVHRAPFFLQVNHIHSAFVELIAMLDTASLSRELKLYLPLYLELVFESPILRNGEVVPYEQVVTELAADTVATDSSLGLHGRRFNAGQFSQAVFITVKVEAEKYEKGVRWLHDLLYCLQFTKERLSVVANKIVNDVARMKRKGGQIVKTLLRKITFTGESSHNLSSMVTQLRFLSSLLSLLKDPSSTDRILQDMAQLQEVLTAPNNLRVVMATNINTLPHPSPVDPWVEFLPQAKPQSSVAPGNLPRILPSQHFVDATVRGKMLLAGVGGVDSNFLLQSVPCVKSHDHPDLPAILVFMEYLCALEGPMWRQIRGMGLSYHYSMTCQEENGLLFFLLFKSSQLVQAYEVAREIVNGFVTGSTPFEHEQLEAAISGVIYEVIESEKSVADASHQAILRYLQQVDQQYSKKLLSAVSRVTIEDLRRVGSQYFSQLLDPSLVNTAVCCNPSKVEEVKKGLEQFGYTVETVEDLDQLAAV